jgi:hypothetical protein
MGKIGNGALSQVGVSILGIGMITGMHAAISPSVFTFRCFARSPREKEIARKTLWISLGATTATAIGLLLVFKEWLPAILSEATAFGLFGLGMYAVECPEDVPAIPSMRPPTGPAPLPIEPGRELVGVMQIGRRYAG